MAMGEPKVSHKTIFEKTAELKARKLCRPQREPQQLEVETEDGCSRRPCQNTSNARIREHAHLGPIAGELNQRNHRKRQLKTEYHLAKNQQRRNFTFAV